MAENHTDPSGNTEAFRAFANTPEPEAATGTATRMPLLVGAAAVAVVLVALAGWLALA
ncbi:hypothetical protein [Micromonospora deserti]|uniref:hypothetical protein n=1 Tax=Micromonospora deserti TaxID=2070366 RepID=UPI0018F36C3C|nr:hypothetical protein [Micromonospora deserti]